MKPGLCIWSDLTLADIRDLGLVKTPQDIKKWLGGKFGINVDNPTMKEKILVDLYFYSIVFTKEHNFNEEQTSAFFSIVKKTHEKATETSFGNLEETFSFFKELLSNHSVKRPPFCVHLFDVQDVKDIQSYMLRTYFRHFKLYKYAFTPKIVMNVSISYKGLQEEEEEEVEEVKEEEGDDKENPLDEEKDELAGNDVEDEEENVQDEDPPALKELKNLIETTLEENINKLRVSVDQKLKNNEENLLKTISQASPPKSGKKGKKK